MRTSFLCISLLFICLSTILVAQPAVQWDKTIGGSGQDAMIRMLPTSDGGYILGGMSSSGISGDKSQASKGDNDYWLVKIAANGTKTWDKTFGSPGSDQLTDLQITADGGYILSGSSSSDAGGDKSENSRGGSDYWIVKVDSKGIKQWDKTIGGSEFDVRPFVSQMPDGSFVLAGTSRSDVSGDKTSGALAGTDYLALDFWIVKLSPTGTILWDKTEGTEGTESIRCINLTKDGGFIVGADQGVEQYNGSYYLMKFKADGSKEWEREVTPGVNYNGYAEINDVQQTPDNGYILGGWSNSRGGGEQSQSSIGGDYWIVKLDANRTVQWERVIGVPLDYEGNGNGMEELVSLVQTSDGGYLLGGNSREDARGDKTENTKGYPEYDQDFWIVKIDSKGDILWDKTIGGTGGESVAAICKSPDGGYLIGGTSGSNIGFDKSQNSKGAGDFWIVKLPADVPSKLLTLSQQSLQFTYKNGSITPQQVVNITASEGTPALTFFTYLPEAYWLVLPQNVTGNSFSFSIDPEDANYLPAGTYNTTVTVLAQGYKRVKLNVTLTKLPAISEEASNTYLRINAGGDAYTASNGKQFKADQYYSGIDRTSSVAAGDILNTTDDALYRTGRSSPSFSYKIPVANGKMNVVLHFAEIWFKQAGKRKFHVNMEGSRKLTDYDIYARAGGAMQAITQTIPVTVTDGVLNIDFISGTADQPRVSAIEVLVSSIALKAVEDTYIRSGAYQYTNYGNEGNLDIKNPGLNLGNRDLIRMAYLKFNVASAGPTSIAKLRLYGYNYENTKKVSLQVYGIDADWWQENYLDFDSRLFASMPALSSVGVSNVAQYYELDVTNYIQANQQKGDSIVTFLLDQMNAVNTRLTFNSSENAVNPPQLVITPASETNPAVRVGTQENSTALENDTKASTVFPNPVTKHFTVEISEKHSEKIELEMINQLGRSYKLEPAQKAEPGYKTEVDISGHLLKTGIYVLKIKSAATTEIIKMLITE